MIHAAITTDSEGDHSGRISNYICYSCQYTIFVALRIALLCSKSYVHEISLMSSL